LEQHQSEKNIEDDKQEEVEEAEVQDEKTILEDVGGLDEISSQLTDLILLPIQKQNVLSFFHFYFLCSIQLYAQYGVRPAQGILLKGEPGVGKTLLVRSLAAKTNAFLTIINGPEIISSYSGERFLFFSFFFLMMSSFSANLRYAKFFPMHLKMLAKN
jgi:ATP-dependent 26S proteasome regulatory subunit